MPRSAASKGQKRTAKNAGVGIDFKKAKHKVGKRLKPAQNATDTNFKSKAISLPGQSVGEHKGAAVSKRNLTIKELLGQVGHYSPKIRFEALHGLSQLLSSHPDELRHQTGPILEKLAERMSDDDRPVRKTLLELFNDRVLPGLARGLVAPFLPLLMAHVSSAMTHLDNNVRSDALGFLEALLQAAPQQVVTGFMTPTLYHYSSLLSPATRARWLSSRSLTSLAEVLDSLHNLLRKAVEDASSPTSTSTSRQQLKDAASPGVPLFAQRCSWGPLQKQLQMSDNLAACSSGGAAAARSGKMKCKAKADASQEPDSGNVMDELIARVLDAWAECAPGHATELADASAAEAMGASLKCLRLLLLLSAAQAKCSLSDVLGRWRAVVLKKVCPFVPIRAPAVRASPAVQQALVQLNLAATQLLVAFLPSASQAEGAEEAAWVRQLLDYYVAVLERGEVLSPPGELADDVQQPSVPADVFQAILTGTQQLLPAVSWHRRAQLLRAVAVLAARSPAKGPVAAACLRFQAAVFARPEAAFYPDAQGMVPIPESEAATWLQAVPKMLWELGSSRPETSRLALRMLHDAARFATAEGPVADVLAQMQPSLALFYSTLVPGQPAKPKAAGKQRRAFKAAILQAEPKLLSPLARLPADIQRLAVDLLFYLPATHDALLTSARLLCQNPSFPVENATRVVDVLAAKHHGHCSQAFLFMLASLLEGEEAEGAEPCPPQRHIALVDSAARCLAHCAIPGELSGLHAVENHLLQACQPGCSARALYGTLHAAAAAVQITPAPAGGTDPLRQADAARDAVASTEAEAAAPSASLSQPAGEEACTAAHSGASERLSERMRASLPRIMARYTVRGESAHGGSSARATSVHGRGHLLPAVVYVLREELELVPPFLEALGQAAHKKPASREAGGVGEEAREDSSLRACRGVLAVCDDDVLRQHLLEWKQPLLKAAALMRSEAQALGQQTELGAATMQACNHLASTLSGLFGPAMAEML